MSNVATASPSQPPAASGLTTGADHRGSPIPTWAMITSRFMELRRRRGLMITLLIVTIGIPTVFFGIRLVLHAVAPKTYGPAGGYDMYTAMTAGVLYTFGFIVAATLGSTAGSVDLTDGMFRHLVITGRSRIALYLARIPAGLAIIWSLVAIGFAIVCVVCVSAAPTSLNFYGQKMPAGMSKTQLENWASDHAELVICRLPSDNIDVFVDCGKVLGGQNAPAKPAPANAPVSSPAEIRAAAVLIADQNWTEYRQQFLYPPTSLMIKTGLWLELEALIGFMVGLGLGSLIGQRTVGVILMIVLEIILTPIALRVQIPHFVNVQRAVVGVATAHLEPSQLPLAFGGGGHDYRLTETTTTAVIVILAWILGWTAVGAWRMATRDA